MGIEDFGKLLTKIGYTGSTVRLLPGEILLVDAMQMLIAGAYVELEILLRGNRSASTKISAEEYRARVPAPPAVPHAELFSAPGEINIGALDPGPGTLWGLLREATLRHIAKRCAAIVASGVVPVLVWDPPILGYPRLAGKVERVPGRVMPLRSADRCWIYLALSALGIPSYVGSTEGEKVAVCSQLGGCGHAILTTDADAVALGTTAAVTGACRPIQTGVLLFGVRSASGVRASLRAACAPGGPEAQPGVLAELAMFLGCDLIKRRRGNSHLVALSWLQNPAVWTHPAPFSSCLFQSADPEEVRAAYAAANFYRCDPAECAAVAEAIRGCIERAAFNAALLNALRVPHEGPYEVGSVVEVLGRVSLCYSRGAPHRDVLAAEESDPGVGRASVEYAGYGEGEGAWGAGPENPGHYRYEPDLCE